MAEREPQRASSVQEFVRRVEAIEDAVREIASAMRQVAQRVAASSDVVPMVAELAREVSSSLERLRSDVESVREQVGRQVPAAFDERVGRIPGEVDEALGTRLRTSVDAISERTTGALDGLRAAVSGLEERLASLVSGGSEATQTRLGAAVDALTSQLRSLEGRLESAVAAATSTTQERLAGALDALASGLQDVEERLGQTITGDALRPLEGLPQQLADAMAVVRDVLTEVAQAQGSVEQRLDEVREQGLRRTDELETGLADALTGVAETLREEQQRATDRLSERLDEIRGIVRQEVEARVRDVEQAVRATIAERSEETRDAVAARVEEIRGAVADRLEEMPGAVGERADAAVERVAERIAARGDDVVAARVADIERALEDAAARATDAAEAQERSLGEFRTELGQVLDGMLVRVDEAAGSIQRAVETSVDDVIRRVADVVPSIADVGTRVQGVLESVDDFRSESGDLREALVQVHRVANALESIGRRRGLKELAETDRRLAEEQAALVDRLTSSGQALAERIAGLEEQLRAAVDAGELSQLQAEVTSRIGAELENLRTSVAEEVERRISEAVTAVLESVREQVAEAVPATVKQAVRTEAKEAMPGKTLTKDMSALAKSQREIDRVVTGVRKDLDDIKKRIATWGKSRGAPRLAQELAAVEERVADVEGLVQEDLVEAVFDRMQKVFDRRFDALVQLIDSRLQPPAEPGVEQRRGLFRRRE